MKRARLNTRSVKLGNPPSLAPPPPVAPPIAPPAPLFAPTMPLLDPLAPPPLRNNAEEVPAVLQPAPVTPPVPPLPAVPQPAPHVRPPVPPLPPPGSQQPATTAQKTEWFEDLIATHMPMGGNVPHKREWRIRTVVGELLGLGSDNWKALSRLQLGNFPSRTYHILR